MTCRANSPVILVRGELSRDSKAENTKGNVQETKSKEGQVETTNETVAIEDDASLEEATERETTKAKTGISKRNTVTLTLTA